MEYIYKTSYIQVHGYTKEECMKKVKLWSGDGYNVWSGIYSQNGEFYADIYRYKDMSIKERLTIGSADDNCDNIKLN